MKLTPKNWKSFQHYTDRRPAWIKLHRGLLDDFTFSRLPLASRALAPLLWLLASEYSEGSIPCSIEEIAFRFRSSDDEVIEAIKPLIDNGFFVADSDMLAACKHTACLEKRERREEREENTSSLRSVIWPEGFLEFYAQYPKKVGKKDAAKAYAQARREVSRETILGSLAKIIPTWGDPKYIPHPSTWLRRGGFYDEPNGGAVVRHSLSDPMAGIT